MKQHIPMIPIILKTCSTARADMSEVLTTPKETLCKGLAKFTHVDQRAIGDPSEYVLI